jgi:hypothetical protein
MPRGNISQQLEKFDPKKDIAWLEGHYRRNLGEASNTLSRAKIRREEIAGYRHQQFQPLPPKVGVTFEHGYDVKLTFTLYSVRYKRDGWLVKVPVEREKEHRGDRVFRVEIKPQLGDDFPSVLRQMRHNQGRTPSGMEHYTTDVLLIGAFDAAGATLEQVRRVFAPYRIVTMAEIEGA